jgi:peptidoglycan glycosyltransferase
VRRGRIYDRNGVLLAGTVPNAGGIFKRTYRDPSLAQTIGYDSDLYGKSGIEAAYDSYLTGRSSGSGWAALVNRSLQRPIVGDDVRLTIDERLQQAVASALPDWPSAAVVADPRSGEILALVSKPYYDPNQLNGSLVAPATPPGRAVTYWNALQAAGAHPFTNRVTNELLTPGSTFKTVTLASALASGVASLATLYTGPAATGPITVDGHVLDPDTNLPRGVTSVDLLHAFVYSDNVAFAEAGLKLGVKRFLAYTHRFGMGRPIPFDLPVAISQVQNPHDRLTGVALANDAFGQGDDRVTPLHMLMVAEGIANGGRIPDPVLVKQVTAPGGAIVRHEHRGTFAMAVGRSAAADTAKAMVLAVRGWSGFKTQLRGIQVAGKTGTAATHDGLPPHAWFICFAPADHPRVAVAVVVEHGGAGAFVAAPIALHILQAALPLTGDPVTRDLAGLYAAVVVSLLGIAWLMVVLRRRALLTVAGMVRLGAFSALTYLTATELLHDHTLLAVLLAAGLMSFDRRLLLAFAASTLLMILAWLGVSISPTLDHLGSVAITAAAALVLTDPSFLAARGRHRSMVRERRRVRRFWLALPACVAGLSLVLAAAGVVYLSMLPNVDDAAARVGGLPVPARVGQAVVAIEDRRFYGHGAIDLLGTLRAAAVDLMATSVQQGGSSIAQQVAKALYLPHEDAASAEPGITGLLSGLGRKLEQMGLAVKLEQRYSKAQILQMYLNSVYFGNQLGVAQASQAYFGKVPSALDWAEASLLAGLPRAPGKYNPTLDYMLARERQRTVLDALVRSGTLSRAAADAAYAHFPALPALPTPPPALLAAVAKEYQATSPDQMANLSARLGRAAASLSPWWNWTSATAIGAWAPAVALLTGGSSDAVAARALVQDVYERLGARPDWAAVDRLMPPSSSAVAPFRVDYASAVAAPSPSFQPAHRPYDRAVRYVVLHDTESSCAAALNTFINPASQASAHFLVCRDGRIYQLVPVADVAWHAGNRYIDDHSIGIELEGYAGGPYTRAQYLASASLLRWIDAHLHLHLQWTPNAIFGDENVPGSSYGDPGSGWDWPRFMDLLHGAGPYLSSSQGGDARLAVVVVPSTPVYACADEACTVLGTATWGEQFHVWVRLPGWIGIDFGGAYGWLAASDAGAGRGAVVRNTWQHPVPVRAAPAPWGRVIGQIPAGEAYASTLTDEGADHRRWWLVAYGHHYAYVCTCDVVRELRTSTPPFVASAALATRSAYHLIAVRSLIETTAQRFGVDPALAAAIAWQESGFNEGSRSATGAVGIMQVEPGTVQTVARLLKRPLDPTREQDNVTAGVYWLAYLLRSFYGDEERAAAAYYEGAGNLARYGYFADTRQYVTAVMALRASFAYHGRSSAASAYTLDSSGYDISYPQCHRTYPRSPYSFGVVGVTGGDAFTRNPCLARQYAWAHHAARNPGGASASAPSFYMNLNYPFGHAVAYGLTGPRGTCRRSDQACIAYNYGYNAAQAAFRYASAEVPASATATVWWLDIETLNYWNPNTSLNDNVIRGAIDYLHAEKVTVGIYSTPLQWLTIAGSSYNPELPNWVAGAKSSTAPTYCSPTHAFGGGVVWLVQYLHGRYDGDYGCGAAAEPAATQPTPTATVGTQSGGRGVPQPASPSPGGAVAMGDSAMLDATADQSALGGWRTVTDAPGIDGSPHPGVPRSVQDAIDWCGKQPLADTPANRAKGVVWLTFDDGGSPTQVRSILATLKHYGVRGRFFLIGQWANANPDLVKQMRAEGHFVGNDTLSHAELFRVRAVKGAPNQWWAADQPQSLIEQQIIGGQPSTLLRFPYGAYDERTLGIMSTVKGPDGRPVEACGWTDDALDWDEARTPTPASELKRIEADISPNAVVLMDLHGRFTPQILPSLIDWLHANGYRTEPLRSASSG